MTVHDHNEKLLIVGSVAFDSVETPAGSVEMAMGGSASYASIAASYWCRPLVVGVVGDDFKKEHFERFEERGVDTLGIEKVRGKTFHWRGRYHDDFKGRDTLETALNVFESFNPEIPEAYKTARYLMLGNIAPELQLRVLEQTAQAELVAMDTMNFWIETARDALEEVIGKVGILFINDEEALQLTGKTSVLGAAEMILTMGPKYAVIKRGEYGALLFGPDLCLFVPAVLLHRVVDPTGAGDTFAGGFLGRLAGAGKLDRPTFSSALIDGTVVASFAVEAFSVNGICNLSDKDVAGRRAQLENMISLSPST
jgi:sugar/nucleoside kinase (ribokinase family)